MLSAHEACMDITDSDCGMPDKMTDYTTEIAYGENISGIPASLISAIIQVESGGDTWAVRYEPDFFNTYLAVVHSVSPLPGVFPPGVSADTERRLRACSFGLMQIMGETAREEGFTGTFLTELCNPTIGILYGSLLLRSKKDKYYDAYGWDGVIAGYNAGSPRKNQDGTFVNQDYVDKVRVNFSLRQSELTAGLG